MALYSKVLYLKWLVLTRSQYAFDRGVLLPQTRGGLTQLQILMKTLEDSRRLKEGDQFSDWYPSRCLTMSQNEQSKLVPLNGIYEYSRFQDEPTNVYQYSAPLWARFWNLYKAITVMQESRLPLSPQCAGQQFQPEGFLHLSQSKSSEVPGTQSETSGQFEGAGTGERRVAFVSIVKLLNDKIPYRNS